MYFGFYSSSLYVLDNFFIQIFLKYTLFFTILRILKSSFIEYSIDVFKFYFYPPPPPRLGRTLILYDHKAVLLKSPKAFPDGLFAKWRSVILKQAAANISKQWQKLFRKSEVFLKGVPSP